jgi:carbonic anhydrase/acetyltransferase-like protein (isoleucine patch superfamily)
MIWKGDVNSIEIGNGVSVGDRVMVHCSRHHPTKVGNNVIIAAGTLSSNNSFAL